MQAIEFQADIKNGIIEIPEMYRQQLSNQVRVIVLSDQQSAIVDLSDTEFVEKRPLTASDLLQSGLVGVWADREDVADSLGFARHLRQIAEHRQRGADASA